MLLNSATYGVEERLIIATIKAFFGTLWDRSKENPYWVKLRFVTTSGSQRRCPAPSPRPPL